MATHFRKSIALLFFLLSLCACKSSIVGNGAGYVGGGDDSTQKEISDALADVLRDMSPVVVRLAAGLDQANLIALQGCDPARLLCHLSSLQSQVKRESARDEILLALSGIRRELVDQPVSIVFVETLPEITDAFGHSRNARAATKATPGAQIMLSAPSYRAMKQLDLRAAMAGDIVHEVMHHLTGSPDADPIGAYDEPDGTQACFTFIGDIFGAVLYPDYGNKSANPPLTSASSEVPLIGIPGGAIRGAPTAVSSHGGIYLFVVGKQDGRVYYTFYNGSVYKPFVAVLPIVGTSSTDVSVIEYGAGLLLATLAGTGVYLNWFDGKTWHPLGGIANQNLTPGGTEVRTTLPPRLISFRGILYVFVVGTDGLLYDASCANAVASLPSGYGLLDGTASTQGAEVFTSNNAGMVYFTVTAGQALLYRTFAFTKGWSTVADTGLTTKVRPSLAMVGTTTWLGYVNPDSGKVELAQWDGLNAPDNKAVDNPPTTASLSMVGYNGQLHVFTTSIDGLLYLTFP